MSPLYQSARELASGCFRKWTCHAAVILTLASATLASFPCTAADDPFEDLRQRIEQLERDNQELRAARSAQLPDASTPLVAAVPPSPDEDLSEEEAQDVDRIGSLVEKYLRKRSVEPVPAEVAQDQNISALQGSVAGILDRLNAKTFPSVQVHGVFQSDFGCFGQSASSIQNYGLVDGGADFRRARLSANGNLTENTKYFLQMDFAFFGRPTFTDVWVEQNEIPYLGNVRIGQWKQPFSLEVVSSFRYTTFAERSVLFQAFTPFRHLGAGFYNNAEDLSCTWAASTFATGQDQYGGTLANSNGFGTAERFTYCPIWDDASNGREYLHLGIGHFFNAPPDKKTVFRTIPELYIGTNAAGGVGTSGQAAPGNFNGTPYYVTTGNMGVSSYNVLGAELLWVEGPLSIQSEFMVNFVNQTSGVGGTVNNTNAGENTIFSGEYVSVGYFLTGEHRPYDRKTGTIDRIKPFHNFSPWRECNGGWGAWEVAGRVSHIDLNSQNITGGNMTDYTAALNWYLNPYWKICFNYIHAMPNFAYKNGDPSTGLPASVFSKSTTDIYDVRVQMDF